jgi:hypothetical protein
MNTKQRVENLERVIPIELPPCTGSVACRVLGLYLNKCGLNPAAFRGDLAFMYDTREANLDASAFDPLSEEDEAFYQTNVGKAVEFWKGRIEGRW